jgi:hypothetical protein
VFLGEYMQSKLWCPADGKSVEVGLIGKEGFLGLSVVFESKTSTRRVVIQAERTAYRLEVEALHHHFVAASKVEAEPSDFFDDFRHRVKADRRLQSPSGD